MALEAWEAVKGAYLLCSQPSADNPEARGNWGWRVHARFHPRGATLPLQGGVAGPASGLGMIWEKVAWSRQS